MNHTAPLSTFNQGDQVNNYCAGENMNRLGRSLLALLAFAHLMCLSVVEAQVTYSIGVNLNGLSGGTVILKNGSDTLPLGTNGSYSFATPLASGSPYAVSVLIQPPARPVLYPVAIMEMAPERLLGQALLSASIVSAPIP